MMTRTKAVRTSMSVDLHQHQRWRSINHPLFLNSCTFPAWFLTNPEPPILFLPDFCQILPRCLLRAPCCLMPTHLLHASNLCTLCWLKTAPSWWNDVSYLRSSSTPWLTRVCGEMGSFSLLSIAGFKSSLLICLLHLFPLHQLHLFLLAISSPDLQRFAFCSCSPLAAGSQLLHPSSRLPSHASDIHVDGLYGTTTSRFHFCIFLPTHSTTCFSGLQLKRS